MRVDLNHAPRLALVLVASDPRFNDYVSMIYRKGDFPHPPGSTCEIKVVDCNEELCKVEAEVVQKRAFNVLDFYVFYIFSGENEPGEWLELAKKLTKLPPSPETHEIVILKPLKVEGDDEEVQRRVERLV